MHGDIEQKKRLLKLWTSLSSEYRFCPLGGAKHDVQCQHLHIFNILKTTAPIFLKFDMMHLWDKGGINCAFHFSWPHGAFGWGQPHHPRNGKLAEYLENYWDPHLLTIYIHVPYVIGKYTTYGPWGSTPPPNKWEIAKYLEIYWYPHP